MHVHNRLRDRRIASGWTQLETARRVGITRQSLIHLESGRFVPSTTVALKLAQVFDCRVEDLFALDEGRVAITADLVPALAGCGEVAFRRGYETARAAAMAP